MSKSCLPSASSAKGKKPATARKGAKDERSNKKAEVGAMIWRAKGVTLAVIMEHTGWGRRLVGDTQLLALRLFALAFAETNRRTGVLLYTRQNPRQVLSA